MAVRQRAPKTLAWLLDNQAACSILVNMKIAAVILFIVALVGFTLWWAVATISAVGGFQMSGHGWFAMFLGVVVTVVLGGVLMGLTFYSSRRGHDEPPQIDRS